MPFKLLDIDHCQLETIKTSLIIILICISFASFGQTIEEINSQSLEYLNKGDIKNAFPLIKKAAEAGHPEAQFNYALFYLEGIEVDKNDSIANNWLLQSAEQGSASSQFKLAYSYAVGRGIEKDMSKAFYWSMQCANLNDPECMSIVANCYTSGMGVSENTDSAIAWTIKAGVLPNLEKLTMSGFITNARMTMARNYLNGTYVEQSNKEAYTWYLIYNESKRDYSILVQMDFVKKIKELETQLSKKDRKKSIVNAEKLINRKLQNLENLYTPDY